jgi:hypothetical protein
MAKIQSLKQWCGSAKCHQIHLGKPSITCPELLVHGAPMKKSNLEKYLGDLVSKELTNKQNIENRQSKAMGIISQIMTLLSEICLGKHYYEIAILLRETMFVNGILTNIEVCYGLTKEEINMLEIVDHILLRKILNAHSKTPVESLYLELGCLPLSYIIKARRTMFLHYLVTRPENELLARFFKVQKAYPVKNDWWITTKDNLREFDIQMEIDEIAALKKERFKDIVKKKTNEKALEYLNTIKSQHSKMENLNYTEIKMKSYLKENISKSQLLFKFRTRMIDVRHNFRSKYESKSENIKCEICNTHDETQNLFECPSLDTKNIDINNVNYNDIFSDTVKKNEIVIEALSNLLEQRESILENSKNPTCVMNA